MTEKAHVLLTNMNPPSSKGLGTALTIDHSLTCSLTHALACSLTATAITVVYLRLYDLTWPIQDAFDTLQWLSLLQFSLEHLAHNVPTRFVVSEMLRLSISYPRPSGQGSTSGDRMLPVHFDGWPAKWDGDCLDTLTPQPYAPISRILLWPGSSPPPLTPISYFSQSPHTVTSHQAAPKFGHIKETAFVSNKSMVQFLDGVVAIPHPTWLIFATPHTCKYLAATCGNLVATVPCPEIQTLQIIFGQSGVDQHPLLAGWGG